MSHHLSGEELATMRRAAGLTQLELATRVGVGRRAVSHWERKALVDLRQSAPRRLLAVLAKAVRPTAPGEFFCALSRARGDGVLAALEQRAEKKLAGRAAAHADRETAARARRRVLCGARTRKGAPCRLLSEPGRRRRKFHGGRSTGPKTAEGRARIAEAQRERWRALAKQARTVDD